MVKWNEITELRYFDLMEVLPPAVMVPGGFLVGEAWDHSDNGWPRYQACVTIAGKFYASTSPITMKEFHGLDRAAVLANVVPEVVV